MSLYTILNDPWGFAILSGLITSIIWACALAAYGTIYKGLASMRGHFTGSYIAITKQLNVSTLLVELVQCRHIGDKIAGTIKGVAFAEYDNERLSLKKDNNSKYKFEGSVNERLFVVSYNTTTKGKKDAGTLTLQGNSNGSTFEGVWGGYDTDTVLTGRCAWIRSPHRLRIPRDKELILETAQELLSSSIRLTETNNSATKHENKTRLRSLNIEAFKSISTNETPFKKMTILTGVNSTGKSSLISPLTILSRLIQDDHKSSEFNLVLISKDAQKENAKIANRSTITSKNPRKSRRKIK